MGVIQKLDEQTINQIAAGEVVESPASVAKELIENAIDAGATEISLEYIGGGLKLLRVADNGHGMTQEDACLAFQQHATSKIRTIKDLQSVRTNGFRGEALASIASVSKIEMTTSNGESTTKVSLIGGEIQDVGPGARTSGTTIEIAELFFNTPARRKFQKSSGASTTELLKTVMTLMLAHTEVAFTVTSLGKVQLSATKTDLKERIEELFGKDFLKNGIRVAYEKGSLSVHGYVGSTASVRVNRGGQYLFVNGRPVQSPHISYAVKDGYGTRIEEKKHPIFILFLQLSGKEVDVNVHPQKKEVRFQDETSIKNFVRHAVSQSFFSTDWKKTYDTSVFTKNEPMPEVLEEPTFEWKVTQPDPQFFEEVERLPVIGKHAHFLFLAAPFLQFSEGVIVMNLKRARKRVFFEKSANESFQLQALMTPCVVRETISEGEIAALKKVGLSARAFGQHETIIDAAAVQYENVENVFFDALETFRLGGALQQKKEDALRLSALKYMSEKWEHKTQAEAMALARELLKTKEPLICPEGKPICKEFLFRELEG